MSDDFKLTPSPDTASDSLIETLHDIASGIKPAVNAETLLGNKPRGRAFDLHYEYTSFAPLELRWSCIDLNSYEPAPDAEAPATFIGRGKTEAEARGELLDLFQEYDERPKERTMLVGLGNPNEPPEVVTVGTYEDWSGDDE